MEKNKIKIGLLGFGTVGTGVWNIINTNKELIEKRLSKQIEISKILVNNINKQRNTIIPKGILTTNADDILKSKDIQIVVEVIGGIEPAKTYITEALENKKHVVTANKALFSKYGDGLIKIALDNDVSINFEASVCGGIPIINSIRESLTANKIEELVGIVNGTTNYILSKMTNEGLNYEDVLKEAQQKGYAEADPTSDVEGYDAMYKLMILASLAFGTPVLESSVYREGISKIAKEDIEYAKELGYSIKLLAIGKEIDEKLELRVHPTFIPLNHPLTHVNDAYNAVYIKGNAVGDLMFYGKGAGELPTGSAVVSDIISVIKYELNSDIVSNTYENYWKKSVKNMRETKSKYYIRFLVKDTPGVMGKVATILGKYDVSLASLIQKHKGIKDAPIVFLTHETFEGNVQDAVAEILKLPEVINLGNIIRVESLS